MTDTEVINSWMFCMNNDCENCTLNGEDNCQNELKKKVLSTMRMQRNALGDLRIAYDQLAKENDELVNKLSVSYTQEQLVKAVNEIIDEFALEDDEDPTGAKICAIGQFMKLAHIHGHIAVGFEAEWFEIRLDK